MDAIGQGSQFVHMSQCCNMKVCVFLMMAVGVFADGLDEDGVYKDALQFVKECGAKTLSLCLKEKALKFIERLPNNIDIGNGIRIKQSDSERVSREYTPINLPSEPIEREAVLDRMLMERIVDYITSHTLELKIPMIMGVMDTEEELEQGRKGGGGGGYGGGGGGWGGGGGGKKGGKKGKKGGMGTMMMMVYMKSALMYALGLKAVGALALKALLVAKVALTLAAVIALKKLFESNKGTSTYEVIAHSAGEDHGGHHDRVFSPADLVYRGYKVGS